MFLEICMHFEEKARSTPFPLCTGQWVCGSDHTQEQMRKNDWKNILETNLRGKRPLGASIGDALRPDNHGVPAVYFLPAVYTFYISKAFKVITSEGNSVQDQMLSKMLMHMLLC